MTACAWAGTPPTRESSSARWPRGASSAVSPPPPRRRSACSTPAGHRGSSSRPSASDRSSSTSRAPPTPRVVVVNPGWGDGVQANKAGLLEVADVFVVNKADRDGADAAVKDLVAMLEFARDAVRGPRPSCRPWPRPATASTGSGTRSPRTGEHLLETGLLERAAARTSARTRSGRWSRRTSMRVADACVPGSTLRRHRRRRQHGAVRSAASSRSRWSPTSSESPPHEPRPRVPPVARQADRAGDATTRSRSSSTSRPSSATTSRTKRVSSARSACGSATKSCSAATRCRARRTPTPSSPPP